MTAGLYFSIGAVLTVVGVVAVTLAVSWNPNTREFELRDGAEDIGAFYILLMLAGVFWPVAIALGLAVGAVALIVRIVARLIEGMVRR